MIFPGILPGSKSQSWASSITRGTCKSMLHEITHAHTIKESLNCTCTQPKFIHNISGVIHPYQSIMGKQHHAREHVKACSMMKSQTHMHKQGSLLHLSLIYTRTQPKFIPAQATSSIISGMVYPGITSIKISILGMNSTAREEHATPGPRTKHFND